MRQSTQSVQRLKHLNLQTRPRVTTPWYASIETKKAEDGSKESYCSRGALKPTANVSKANDCSKEARCISGVWVSSCSSAGNTGAQVASAALDSVVAAVPTAALGTGIFLGFFL